MPFNRLPNYLAALTLLASCEAAPNPIVEVPDDGHIGAGPDEAVDPSQPGPFAVGVSTFTVDDPNRINPTTGEPRHLIVEVWYPTEDASDALPRVQYGVEDLLTPEQIAPLGIDPAQEAHIVTDAARDVVARTDQGPYPLIIFSHGNGGVRFQSVFLTVHLASHGYVVASLDHEGNTLSDLFDSGSGLPTDILAVAQDRPEDVRVVIDAMLARNEADGDPLAGTIDPNEIGVTGHSFGGYTSLAVAALDPRVKAIAPLAPPSIIAISAVNASANDVQIPTFIFAGGKDLTLPFSENQLSSFNILPNNNKLLINIIDAGHFTFSDICIFDLERLAQIAGINTNGILNDGCGDTNIDPARGHEITNTFATAFFNAILRDSFPSRLQLRDLLQQVNPIEAETLASFNFSIAP